MQQPQHRLRSNNSRLVCPTLAGKQCSQPVSNSSSTAYVLQLRQCTWHESCVWVLSNALVQGATSSCVKALYCFCRSTTTIPQPGSLPGRNRRGLKGMQGLQVQPQCPSPQSKFPTLAGQKSHALMAASITITKPNRYMPVDVTPQGRVALQTGMHLFQSLGPM